jgi:hypothetical protein
MQHDYRQIVVGFLITVWALLLARVCFAQSPAGWQQQWEKTVAAGGQIQHAGWEFS